MYSLTLSQSNATQGFCHPAIADIFQECIFNSQETTAVSDGARTRCTTSPISQVLPISTLTTANANFLSRTSPAVPSPDPPIQVAPKQATMPVPPEHRALCLATLPGGSFMSGTTALGLTSTPSLSYVTLTVTVLGR